MQRPNFSALCTLILQPSPMARALNLPRTRLFRLLGIMTLLLTVLMSLSGAAYGVLHQLHANWQLARSQSILVYLPPATPPASLEVLHTTLPTLSGVEGVRAVPAHEVNEWLTPLLPQGAAQIPLPVVVEIQMNPEAPRAPVHEVLASTFPLAEIDDQATVSLSVAKNVQRLQLGMVAIGTVVMLVLTLMVALLVRAGLMAQGPTIALLIQHGATDLALASTLTWQACRPVLLGALAGMGLAALVFRLAAAEPLLAPHAGFLPWALLVVLPLLLPLFAAASACLTSLRLLHRSE